MARTLPALILMMLFPLAGCGKPQESAAESLSATGAAEPLNRAQEEKADELVAKLEREAELRRQTARAASAAAQLNAIRSQLELYQVQHNGQYPDLLGRQWEPLVARTEADGSVVDEGRFGPYLTKPSANPFTDATNVAADASGDWQYEPATGELRLVVAADLAPLLGKELKHGRDFIVSTRDAAGIQYHVSQELADIEASLQRQEVSGDELKRIEHDLPQVEASLDKLLKRFRAVGQMKDVVDEMTKLATDSGLKVEYVRTLPPAFSPVLAAQPVRMRVTGGFDAFTTWLPKIDDGFSQRIDMIQLVGHRAPVQIDLSLATFYLPDLLGLAEHSNARSATSPAALASRLEKLDELLARAKRDNLLPADLRSAAAERCSSARERQQRTGKAYELKQRYLTRKKVLADVAKLAASLGNLDRPTAAMRRFVQSLPAAVVVSDIRIIRNVRAGNMAFEALGQAADQGTITGLIGAMNRSRHFTDVRLQGLDSRTADANAAPTAATPASPAGPRVQFHLRGFALGGE